jgi:Uri superfamily endonuclease
MGAMTIEMPLLAAVQAALPGSKPVDMAAGGSTVFGKGAYVLVIALREPVVLPLGGIVHQLSAGHYLYAGSAHGPGGIDARVRRHFRREKSLHWHVDRLTTVAASIHAFAIEGGSECEIVTRLSGRSGARHPIPGFGSSDCRTCVSHLLRATGERMTSHICEPADGDHV